jgi:hypothetical protein
VTLHDLGDVIIFAGTVAGALITLSILAKWLILRPLKAYITKDVVTPIHQVRAEVTENEGRSMKDAVVRLENRVAVLDARFADHITLHGQVLKTEDEK